MPFAVAALPLLIGIAPAGERHFAPPCDQAIGFMIETLRDDGTGPRRFVAQRTLTFQCTDRGYVAVLRQRSSSATGSGDGASASATMFDRAMAGLAGIALRFDVGRDGRIAGAENADAAWARIAAGIDRMGAAGAARPSRTHGFAEAMRRVPADDRQRMLVSMVAPLIAPVDTSQPARRVVSVPVTGANGETIALGGVSVRERVGDKLWRITTVVTGTVPGASPGSDIAVRLTTTTEVDAATGLLVRQTEETTRARASTPDRVLSRTRTTVRQN